METFPDTSNRYFLKKVLGEPIWDRNDGSGGTGKSIFAMESFM